VNQYAQYSGPLLALAGFAFQWVRQYSHVKEFWTGIFAVGMALAVYALCFDYTAHKGVQESVILGILWLSGAVPTVLGGTFTASKASGSIKVIPPTDSK
jgi:hypothetical protein